MTGPFKSGHFLAFIEFLSPNRIALKALAANEDDAIYDHFHAMLQHYQEPNPAFFFKLKNHKFRKFQKHHSRQNCTQNLVFKSLFFYSGLRLTKIKSINSSLWSEKLYFGAYKHFYTWHDNSFMKFLPILVYVR